MTWAADAACRGQTRLMYPHEGETDGQRRRRTREALTLCDACPVQKECAAEAPTHMRGTGGVMAGRVWKTHRDYQPVKPSTTSPVRPSGMRPRTIICEDCGVVWNVAQHGGVPRRCRRCREARHVEARRRWTLTQAKSEPAPCPICGDLFAEKGVYVHMAKTHGVSGMTNYSRAG